MYCTLIYQNLPFPLQFDAGQLEHFLRSFQFPFLQRFFFLGTFGQIRGLSRLPGSDVSGGTSPVGRPADRCVDP